MDHLKMNIKLSNDGHCYGTREQLLEESEKILEIVTGTYRN